MKTLKIHGGGARDRKRKLLDKQKKGKARAKQFGKVEIPQEAFIGVLKINKENSLNKFLKENFQKHYPAKGEASLCGLIIECDEKTGLAKNINQFIHGGILKNSH